MHTMIRALVSCAICICANSACHSSIRSPRPSGAGEIPPPSPVPESPAHRSPFGIHWAPSQHALSIEVITEEPSIGRRDSTRLLSRVVLRPDSSKGVLQAYLASEKSAPAPAAPDSLVVLQLDANGVIGVNAADSTCISRPPGLSPLIIRLLYPRYTPTWPAEDTLTYRVCLDGVPAMINAQIQWNLPASGPDSSTYAQIIHFTGTVTADSSHALPLKLVGLLNGAGEIAVNIQTSQIVYSKFTIRLSLTGTSSLKRQELTQTLIITRLSGDA